MTITYKQLIDEAYAKYCELFNRNAPLNAQVEAYEDYLELVEEFNATKEHE